MFLHPSSDLLEQVLGHIDGAGLAPLGEGEVMGLVQRATVVAGAGGLTAAFIHPGQAGRQDRAGRDQLLESPLEHPADQGGVARHMHRWSPGTSGKWTLVLLPANRDRKSYAAIATGATSSIWHFALTFATDFEVQLNG